MKVLIIGVCGFVGSTVAEYLIEHREGLTVFGIDNHLRAGSWINRKPLTKMGVRIVHADIRNPSDFESLPPVDWVIDAAAIPSAVAGLSEEFTSLQVMQHNVFGTVHIAEYLKKCSAGMIFLSSSRVYSINDLNLINLNTISDRFEPSPDSPQPEGLTSQGVCENFSTASPISLYGVSKLACEQILQEYASAFGLPLYINRCGVISGPGQFAKPDQGIVPYWIHSWHAQRPLTYYGFNGKGYQVRDCLHPRDLSAVILRQLETSSGDRSPIFNISGAQPNSFSLRELSNWCHGVFGSTEIHSSPTVREYDVPWLVLDNDRAKRAWNWKPQYSKEDIFSEVADFARSNPNWLEQTK